MDGFNTFEKQDKLLIGMSGGVDSSVAVRILQEQGFAVQGAVIRFSPAHDAAVQAAEDAAKSLGIPLHIIDAGAAFEEHVVRPFCESYCAGRTPNPCIRCNPLVKFRQLFFGKNIPHRQHGHWMLNLGQVAAHLTADSLGDGVS